MIIRRQLLLKSNGGLLSFTPGYPKVYVPAIGAIRLDRTLRLGEKFQVTEKMGHEIINGSPEAIARRMPKIRLKNSLRGGTGLGLGRPRQEKMISRFAI